VQKFDWMLVGAIYAVRAGFIRYPRDYTPFSFGLERVREAYVVWLWLMDSVSQNSSSFAVETSGRLRAEFS
jgi:hypothetical protein